MRLLHTAVRIFKFMLFMLSYMAFSESCIFFHSYTLAHSCRAQKCCVSVGSLLSLCPLTFPLNYQGPIRSLRRPTKQPRLLFESQASTLCCPRSPPDSAPVTLSRSTPGPKHALENTWAAARTLTSAGTCSDVHRPPGRRGMAAKTAAWERLKLLQSARRGDSGERTQVRGSSRSALAGQAGPSAGSGGEGRLKAAVGACFHASARLAEQEMAAATWDAAPLPRVSGLGQVCSLFKRALLQWQHSMFSILRCERGCGLKVFCHTRGQRGNWLQPFVHFAPMESDLVTKVGSQERCFGCVGSAAIAPRRYHDSHLHGAGFEPGSPGSSVVDRTTALP
jgi:hypothetical protein